MSTPIPDSFSVFVEKQESSQIVSIESIYSAISLETVIIVAVEIDPSPLVVKVEVEDKENILLASPQDVIDVYSFSRGIRKCSFDIDELSLDLLGSIEDDSILVYDSSICKWVAEPRIIKNINSDLINVDESIILDSLNAIKYSTVKWILTVIDPNLHMRRCSEILAMRTTEKVEFTNFALLGDRINIIINVYEDNEHIKLHLINKHNNPVKFSCLRIPTTFI